MRLLAIAAVAACGSAAAHAQTYSQLMDVCRNTRVASEPRVTACTTALSRAQPDSTADRALIHLNRADASLALGRFDAAISDADESAALMDRYQPAQNMRCWARAVANKEIEVGRAACQIALDIQGDDAGALDSSGLMALREGNWQRAWSDYDRALAIDDGMIGSLYGRGLAAVALGRADGEMDLIKAAPAAAEFRIYGLTPEGVKARAAAKPAD